MIIFEGLKSSNVKSIKYDEHEKKLYVEFSRKNYSVSPRVEYLYTDVSNEEFKLIQEAESVGSTLRKVIKGKEFQKIILETDEAEIIDL